LEGRRRRHDELDARIGEWAARVELTDALGRLLGAGIPAAAVVTGRDLIHNEQLRARGYYEPIGNEVIGDHMASSLPFRFASRREPWIRRSAPLLGEHNREVLAELGVDETRMRALEARRVIGT